MASTTEIKVPELGESVSEATIAAWHKKEGDAVALDETILELETEKVTLEVNASHAGTLSQIKASVGDTVTVGDVLGLISTDNVKTASSGAAKKAQPNTEPKKDTQAEDQPPAKANLEKPEAPSSIQHNDQPKGLAPSARKIAAENNLDTALLSGTGKDGRVTKGDVLTALEAKTSQPNHPKSPSADAKPHEERIKMTRLRKTIASRLKDAQNTAAMLTTFNEVDMSTVMAVRKQYKDAFEKKYGVKLGFMSFFVKACITALKEIPAVNASIDEEDLVYKNHYDIGVAVSTPQGLVVPVLRDADHLNFAAIEKNISDLGHRAREGKLSMQDLSGGTFTITNGGIFGSLMSTPILNPPQSGILGMHTIQERAVVVKGEITIRPMMYIALTYDHRIIDGREAVTFLIRVKECIEAPNRLLLDI